MLWAVIGVTCVVGIVFWFMLTLQCQPVDFFWQRVRLLEDPHADVSGTCMNLDHIIAVAYVYSVTATLCDLALGLLPIALVWNLHMNVRTKCALAGILGMGCMYVYPLMPLEPNSVLTYRDSVRAQQSSFASPTCTTTRTPTSCVSFYPSIYIHPVKSTE